MSGKPEKVKQSEKAPQTSKLTSAKTKKQDKAQDNAKGKKKTDSRKKSVASHDCEMDPSDVNELVVCALCKHDMCSPKHLPCLHTFCETCITKHIEKEKSQSTNMHVVCPTCEHRLSVPRSSDEMKSFAENLPSSTLVSSLLCKKDLVAKKCKRCKQKGKDTEADNWCAYCAQMLCEDHLEYHTSLTGGRHTVYDAVEVIRDPYIGFAPKKCRIHEKEDMKLFCNDHWNVSCNICSKRLHGMCNTCLVEYDTSTINTHAEVTNLKDKLETLTRQTEKIRQDILTNIENINKQVIVEKENIQGFRMEINKRMDALESQLVQELDKVHEEKLKELEREAKCIDMKHKSALLYKTMMSAVLKDLANTHNLITLSDIRQNTHRLIDELRSDNSKRHKIGINVSLNHETFNTMMRIGNVITRYFRSRSSQSPSRQPSQMSKMSSPRLQTTIKFQSSPRITQH